MRDFGGAESDHLLPRYGHPNVALHPPQGRHSLKGRMLSEVVARDQGRSRRRNIKRFSDKTNCVRYTTQSTINNRINIEHRPTRRFNDKFKVSPPLEGAKQKHARTTHKICTGRSRFPCRVPPPRFVYLLILGVSLFLPAALTALAVRKYPRQTSTYDCHCSKHEGLGGKQKLICNTNSVNPKLSSSQEY